MSDDKKYPEHEKLQNIRHETQTVGEFLEWASGQGYFLAQHVIDEDSQYREQVTIRVPKSIEQLLAEWHGIDLHKLEREKQDMLGAIRAQNNGGSDADAV